MSKKSSMHQKDYSFINNIPSNIPSNIPNTSGGKCVQGMFSPSSPGISSLSKWVPLICAGAAVGVSILALKEIKNVRKELIVMKKEQVNPGKDELNSRIELMDEQLRKITQYLANQNKPVKQKENVIIKEALPDEPEKVKIINSENEDEYEEVTDDEE